MSRNTKSATILVADDDPAIRGNLALLLRSEGFTVVEASDGDEALTVLNQGRAALALLDLKMPKIEGMEVLRRHADRLEETPVIVITAFGTSSAPIEAMKLGAYDYITKPFDLDEVLFTVRRALMQRSLIAQVEALTVDPIDAIEPDRESELIGRTPEMLTVFKTVGRVAPTDASVLVVGESGTGKELVANAIHRYSARANGPFVKVNCAALSPGLLESELFGHEKGAFTGAIARRRGRFEHADTGTLFLDEIGEMDIDVQAKLLRVLQTGRFERVGGEETIAANVRTIAASNRDLPARIKEGKFREDLYFRLNVMTIDLPPLRDRRDDIPLLTDHIIRELGRKYHWPHLAVAPEALDELRKRNWPGNVRELQNVLARAAILVRGRVIQNADLDAGPKTPDTSGSPTGTLVLRDALAEVEKRVIHQALVQENWNRTQAARVLGISRRQLFDKIRHYDLHD
jgi:two-component system, NtrC family, response regulator AtoC